ncbi:MAG TPA: TolC family protein [Terriglobales bacterium]|nr:TolC family protein [Terriglobales bacterium]
MTPALCLVVAAVAAAPTLAQDAPGSGDQAAAQTEASPQAPPPAPSTQVQVQQAVDYSKPRSHFPNPFKPYLPRIVADPVFSNAPRIEQLMRDGKLMLSLDDAIALALENNLDLAIARYNLSIADTDILRTKAGGSARGVATGLVQGTPGGGVGGFGTGASGTGAGGTTGGAGGAGGGASGLVTSTLGVGTPVDSFDPVLSSTLNINHASFPLSNTVTTGTSTLAENFGTADFTYTQGFHTGAVMSVTFNNQRSTTNSLFGSLSPQVSSNFRLTLRQHLLAGFGFGPNTRFIRIAKHNREISDAGFKLQVIATVSQIQNIYWDLVNAYEDVKVRERSLGLADKTLSDNRKQVEIGTLAPIEIVRAESESATRNQELIVAQTNLQLQQLLIKNAITRNLNDPALATAPVIPTDSMQVPEIEPVVPISDLIKDAMSNRGELEQSRIDLVNRDINKKSARNALLPVVDFIAWYGGAGLGGDQNPLNVGLPPGTIPRSGFYNSFARLLDNSAPDYAVGLNVTIPIRNRAAQADQTRSELEYRQAQLRFQQLQNQVGIEVRNAQYALQQNRARVEAAQKGRELAQQSLGAEQKKYALGASTNFLVLQAQRDLTASESAMVSAMSAYEKSRVELDRVTGLTLQHYNIQLDDAVSGRVGTMPAVPGVMPRTDMGPPPPDQNPR